MSTAMDAICLPASSQREMPAKTLGIVNGIRPESAPDLCAKLKRSFSNAGAGLHVLADTSPFDARHLGLSGERQRKARKLNVFAACRDFAAQGADAILLPCLDSHAFRGELQAELDVPILDMMAALRAHVANQIKPGATLGVLASDFAVTEKLFEHEFGADYELAYPSLARRDMLQQAFHQPELVASTALPAIDAACGDLAQQGAVMLLPGFTELVLMSSSFRLPGIDLPDIHAIYADYALGFEVRKKSAPFRLGVVGGVGPAATIDFMGKVIDNTDATRDQDHIRMVVDHNPQIPDRTANLLHHDTDPTVALFASCKRLEADGAQAIAIPCNTAHAFVDYMQPHLRVPIINMLDVTMSYVREHFGTAKAVGLLATAGTVASGVYHAAAARESIRLMTPAPAFQDKVNNAIYGRQGIKAGFTTGLCREELLDAAAHLAEQGAEVLILGCTELPLALQAPLDIKGRPVALVDPTTVLAQRCVALADSHVRSGHAL